MPRVPRSVAIAAALLCNFAHVVHAQSLVVTAGVVVAATNDPVPGMTALETFVPSSSFDLPVLDDNGKVWFRGRMTGGATLNTNSQAYYYGDSRASLQAIVRSGDAEPSGTIPFATLQTATATGPGSSYHLNGAGSRMIWGTNLYDGGAAINSSNDSALYVGDPINGWSVLAREGDLAPGTPGCTYTQSFTSPTQTAIAVNDGGRVLFRSTLDGGDVTGTADNEAWFSGTVGSLAPIVREQRTQISSGEYIGTLGSASQMNSSGQLLLSATLSTTFGPTPATTNDDSVICLYDPTLGLSVLLREGDAAPGLPGVTYLAPGGTFNNLTAFNDSGESIAYISLNGAVTSSDNTALYKLSVAGNSLLVRKGDAAVGIAGATYNLFGASTVCLNDNGQIAFAASVNGTAGSSDNTGVWAGAPGALQLVAQEGQAAPGAGGSTFGDTSSQAMRFNDAGQLLFHNNLVGGASSGSSLWSWDPACGLQAVILNGDSFEYSPGQFSTITGYSAMSSNNGDGRPLCLDDNGRVAVRLLMSGGIQAIVTVDVGGLCAAPPSNYCTAGTTTNGCVASISATDNPSVSSATTCVLTVANVEGQKLGLMFYGVQTAAANWCVGGTSVLCVKAPTQRTALQSSSGTNNACDGAMSLDWHAFQATNPGALGNPWSAGDFVYAQAWFRDPPACKTTNLSNALRMRYVP